MAKKTITLEEVKQAEKQVGAKALNVYSDRGQFVRTYSAEIHGANFDKLAEEFVATNGGVIRKAG